MTWSKAKIYNLALNALMLRRQIIDTENDKSNECQVLNNNWDTALNMALADMDLDSTMATVDLELIEADPNDDWGFSYKYPQKCAFFRRIKSGVLVDSRSTHIDKRVQMLNNVKVILTDQEDAEAEIITEDFPWNTLSGAAGLTVALRLAVLSAPLITGKGASRLLDSLEKRYAISRAEAQAIDSRENFTYNDPAVDSEWVEERTS